VRLSPPSRFRSFAWRGAAPAVVLLAACAALAACGSSDAPAATSAPAAHAGYPVTVTSCGVPVTYDRAPARAVSNDINTTEDMLALGLESRMAGTFGVTGDGPAGHPVPAPYLAGFRKVRQVSPDYFTREELVALRPDFLFAGWDYGLQQGTSLTPAGLAQFGIKTLILVPRSKGPRLGQHQRHLHRPAQPRRDLQRPSEGPAGHRHNTAPGGRRARQGGRAQAGHGLRL